MERASANQWKRSAVALAALFGSLPIAGRLLSGEWMFPGALELSVLCLFLAGYLHIQGRRFRKLPDGAMMIDRASEMAAQGRTERALAMLSDAIRLNPELWQARQYRGELYLATGRAAEALRDFEQAIALAPEEMHLRVLEARAREAMEADLDQPA